MPKTTTAPKSNTTKSTKKKPSSKVTNKTEKPKQTKVKAVKGEKHKNTKTNKPTKKTPNKKVEKLTTDATEKQLQEDFTQSPLLKTKAKEPSFQDFPQAFQEEEEEPVDEQVREEAVQELSKNKKRGFKSKKINGKKTMNKKLAMKKNMLSLVRSVSGVNNDAFMIHNLVRNVVDDAQSTSSFLIGHNTNNNKQQFSGGDGGGCSRRTMYPSSDDEEEEVMECEAQNGRKLSLLSSRDQMYHQQLLSSWFDTRDDHVMWYGEPRIDDWFESDGLEYEVPYVEKKLPQFPLVFQTASQLLKQAPEGNHCSETGQVK